MIATAPLISVRGLGKTYETRAGDHVLALENINFDVPEGSFVSLVGPSGCGKSTLLKILGGLLSRTSGQVLLGGTPVEGPRQDIGFVFQSPVLLPWWTVLQNTLLPAVLLGLDKERSRQRALSLLELVGLRGFESKYPRELSGGMQQRVSIIRALLHDPAMLLMDEPFGALDAMTRESMNLELQRLWMESRKTILFVTHSIPEAVFLSDWVVVLSPRPGRVARVLEVRMPRPRSLDVMTTVAFGDLTRQIRGLLNAQGGLDG